NNGLRLWLRSGGEGDPEVAVDHALALVREVWGSPSAPVAPAAATPAPAPPVPVSGGGGGEDEVIVMVARKGTPMWRVVQQIEAAVGEN
ncbi:TetR family transcriptional regulator, partial [Streptomyces californicus]